MALDGFYELLPSPPHDIPDWAQWDGLTPWVRTPIKAPTFMLGDCPGQLLSDYHNCIGEADTGLFTVRDVAVTGRGFLIRDGKGVSNNYIGHSSPWCADEIASGAIRPLEQYVRVPIDRAVLLLGAGHNVYGHWIVDILPKLYGLQRLGHDIATLRYLVPADTPRFGFAWLEAIGLRLDQMILYDPSTALVEVGELLVPTFLRSGSRASRLFREAALFMKQRVQQSAGWAEASRSGGSSSIFVSRARADRGGRSVANREAIEAIAVQEGYVLVYPERLDIAAQVACFASATRIVGEYGSGLHNSIFSEPGTRVCCLRSTARHPGFLQSGLADVMQQECGYVFGAAPIDAIDVRFEIDEADVRQALQLMSLPAA